MQTDGLSLIAIKCALLKYILHSQPNQLQTYRHVTSNLTFRCSTRVFLGVFHKTRFFMKKMVQPPLHVIEQGFIEKMLRDY